MKKRLRCFVKAFQKEYPKVKVTYTRQHGGEAMELLKREYQTGRIMYDVVQIHPDAMDDFLELDAIQKIPLDGPGHPAVFRSVREPFCRCI